MHRALQPALKQARERHEPGPAFRKGLGQLHRVRHALAPGRKEPKERTLHQGPQTPKGGLEKPPSPPTPLITLGGSVERTRAGRCRDVCPHGKAPIEQSVPGRDRWPVWSWGWKEGTGLPRLLGSLLHQAAAQGSGWEVPSVSAGAAMVQGDPRRFNVIAPWTRAHPSRIQVNPSDPALLPSTFCCRGDRLGLSLSCSAPSAGQWARFSGGHADP